jgi:hypothetical protein
MDVTMLSLGQSGDPILITKDTRDTKEREDG